jgi:two-component system alkaline phosphatase synthesis response regulator PhoP
MNKTIKVLIVEDEDFLIEALEDRFLVEGFAVLKAMDGKEGLQSALENKPDIILLDIVMPVMDGVTMLHLLREKEEGKNIPVIFLTNLSSAESIYGPLSDMSSGYLVKANWKLDDVVKKVKEVLKK